MRLVSFLAVGALAPIWLAPGQVKVAPDTRPVKPSTRVQLQLEIDPVVARPGGQIFARLRLKNVSDKAVTLQDSDPNYDFRVSVVGASGREPDRTAWGDTLLRGEVSLLHNRTMDLQPGQEQQVSVEITHVYRFTQPGTYYARVVRNGVWTEALEDNQKFLEVAYSNPVEFKIVSEDSSPAR
jgi:hypothetical protein